MLASAVGAACTASRRIEPLSAKEPAIIVAYGAFEKAFNATLARIRDDQREQFEHEAPQYAVKLIATTVQIDIRRSKVKIDCV